MSKKQDWYFFAQEHSRAEWKPYLSDTRELVMQQFKPEFTTVLEVNQVWDKGSMPHNLTYRGNLYFDWDGEGTIGDVLDSVRQFIAKLEKLGFDGHQARWYLSGKKGVHCLIPTRCFLDENTDKTLKTRGLDILPAVYRLMAGDEKLVTYHMDLSIYSGGRGRMWRVVGCKRTLADGKTVYKVPVSFDKLKRLDEAAYWEWVSEPRAEVPVAEPTLNAALAALFAVAASKVGNALNRRKTAKPVDFSAWSDTPPTLKNALKGEGINQQLGLNDLKLQLCIAAAHTSFKTHADEDEFIRAADGFIRSRVGLPGAAHQTYESIEKELRLCFRVVVGNPVYEYTVKGIQSVLMPSERDNPDLTGKAPAAETDEAERQREIMDLSNGKVVNDQGAWIIQGDEARLISNYAWDDKFSLMKIVDRDGRITGHLVKPMVRKKLLDPCILTIEEQLDGKKMARHIMSLGGHLEQVGPTSLSQIRAAWAGYAGESVIDAPEVEAVPIEGIYTRLRKDFNEDDFILDAERDYSKMFEMFWIESQNVVESKVNRQPGATAPCYLDQNNPTGRYGIDLSKAPYTLADTKIPMKDCVHHLLEMNGNFFAMAAILGWTTACLFKHSLYLAGKINNFPILQVYGDQGCGKTTTMNTILKLFSWKQPYRVTPMGGATPAALNLMATGSMSVPLVIDEVKFQNLDPARLKAFRDFMQNIYTIGGTGTKAGGRSEGSHHNGLVRDPAYASVAFIGETLETSQASLMERIVAVCFHTSDKNGRREHVEYLQTNGRTLGILGWTLVHEVLNADMNHLVTLYEQTKREVSQALNHNADRHIQNAQIITTGFAFFRNIIEKYFPKAFSDKLEAMEHALRDPAKWERYVPSEVVRVMAFLSQASYENEYSRTRLIPGFHYEVTGGGDESYLIASCDRMYVTYRERMKGIGETAVYSSGEEFFHALKNSSLTTDALDHPTLGPNCVKIPTALMKKERIKMFKI